MQLAQHNLYTYYLMKHTMNLKMEKKDKSNTFKLNNFRAYPNKIQNKIACIHADCTNI